MYRDIDQGYKFGYKWEYRKKPPNPSSELRYEAMAITHPKKIAPVNPQVDSSDLLIVFVSCNLISFFAYTIVVEVPQFGRCSYH
jgi:hypothetical protein